ncbi:hypothetical protein SAMN05660297_02283 [Natronincola peptidivorans]|uniref:Uncharacterized protein n=1 Tax=Natronincola peptidivorans TaxID=426128 RepID=A0A1I0E614_9FIRM|nr:hypothetical protein [Natronincola peptidivorans]SET40245.1 hypothetical protein SAMN05660297_02283 [Natronincola peptidivorans]
MKKLISLIIVVSFVFTSLVGCSTPANSTDAKSEEELREEIRAELEAEKAAENNALRDRDALYKFVKQEIINITEEIFDTWEIYYFDITEDGMEEAVLVHPYGVDWYDKVEIISWADGKYRRISSDIYSGKYGTSIDFKDGFLVVEVTTGGTGEQMTSMDLFKYDSPRMIHVLSDITISHSVAFPNADFESTGKINGGLTNFTYTLTTYDNRTNKETIEIKQEYVYNTNNRSFDIKTIEAQKSSQNQASTSENSQPSEGKPLEKYEFNKTYKYDFRENGSPETFSVVLNREKDEIYLLVEGFRYDLGGTDGQLVNSDYYKITKHLDEGYAVFAVSQVHPPHGDKIVSFNMYLPGYDVELLGWFETNMDVKDMDIKQVSRPANVKIGNRTYDLITLY